MELTNYIHAAPEMVLLGMICVVLLADLFVSDEKRVITFWLAMASLAVTLATLFMTAPDGRTLVFTNSYVSDPLSQVLKIAAVGFVAVVFLYSRDYLKDNDIHKASSTRWACSACSA